MGTYILLVNSTDQGAKGIREIPDRQQSSRDTAAKLGIVRKNVFMTFGPYDFVQIHRGAGRRGRRQICAERQFKGQRADHDDARLRRARAFRVSEEPALNRDCFASLAMTADVVIARSALRDEAISATQTDASKKMAGLAARPSAFNTNYAIRSAGLRRAATDHRARGGRSRARSLRTALPRRHGRSRDPPSCRSANSASPRWRIRR
jgi:hypothetical protein